MKGYLIEYTEAGEVVENLVVFADHISGALAKFADKISTQITELDSLSIDITEVECVQ